MKVAVIGGGAAGYFAAINCKRNYPEAQVEILEKTRKVLSKVKISGGGRCNVTHDSTYVSELVKNYPRGGKKLKKVFSQFGVKETIDWFRAEGVQLKVESDGRMFPVTDHSQTIIDALENARKSEGVLLKLSHSVTAIRILENRFILQVGENLSDYDNVIITTGGHPKKSKYQWIENTGIKIMAPVPSLFTFNMPDEKITDLMGVVQEGIVKIPGTSFSEKGPILITHWGMSGPAVLKLSAWAARHLEGVNYNFNIKVNWVAEFSEVELRTQFNSPDKRKLKNRNPLKLPKRLWEYLLERSGIDSDQPWERIPKSKKNKLLHILSQDDYQVKGKTTFKEEFVTCGGVDLSEIDMKTMASKRIPRLFFAGEVLDIDAVTGGFNFQAAWSSAFVASGLGRLDK